MMEEGTRHSGLLCHLTSLPSRYGVGDLGPMAMEFVDLLRKAHQDYWQILPIGNTDDSGCPYATDSAFGCAEYYVSPELLIRDYGLDDDFFDHYISSASSSSTSSPDRVDFKKVKADKLKMLAALYPLFVPDEKYQQFLEKEKEWLGDYCTFRALSENRSGTWREWGKKDLSPSEKERAQFYQFCQYTCFLQLKELQDYAHAQGVKLVGDLPIFVSYQSMDVWKDPRQFMLNQQGEMEYETGAAPDAFSETGQKWGTPLYDWDFQKAQGYEWWKERLLFLGRYFDVVRIDHFRGFCATWISRVCEQDASRGHWQKGPGADLFNHLLKPKGAYPEVIAEDLGYITSDVEELRDHFHFPGMKVFQFMSEETDNPHKLCNYHYNSVAYSGTHDCDTLMGWFKALSKERSTWVQKELQASAPPTHWDMLKVLLETPARTAIIQIQDVLGLGSEARFNYPGTVSMANWTWRMDMQTWQSIDWARLGALTKSSKRVASC